MMSTDLNDEAVSHTGQLDRGWLDQLVGYHLRMAHVALHRDFALTMSSFDLTQKQLAAIELIATNPGASQVDIAHSLSMDRATMMGVVKRLQAKGLVERRNSTSDRRRQEIRLTQHGTEVLRTVHSVIEEHERKFCAVLDDAEQEALINMLKRLYRRSA